MLPAGTSIRDWRAGHFVGGVEDGEAGEAMLLRQSRPGAEPDRLAAGKILYHPATQYLKLDEVITGRIQDLPGSDEQKSKKNKKKGGASP